MEEIMLKKLFLAVVLSLSVSCFAQSEADKSKSSTDSNQQTQTSQSSSSSTTKKDSQVVEDPNKDKKPSMIEYCRKHTC